MVEYSKSTNVAFVILHYITAELTSDCIESILRLGNDSAELKPVITVIDNASDNGSFDQLKKRYGNNPRILLIKNQSNLGFSRANNVAFAQTLKQFSPKHVVILNNDTVIDQADFLTKLELVYEREGRPYIIGPDIYVRRKNFHQSPFRPALDSIARLEADKAKYEAQRDQGGIPTFKLGRVKASICSTKLGYQFFERRNARRHRKFKGWKVESRNAVLHGAGMVFTNRFVGTNELPFEPVTFLYGEELILAARCKANGWPTYYTPELQIIHFDDGSTDSAYKTFLEKELFMSTQKASSLETLICYMKTNHIA